MVRPHVKQRNKSESTALGGAGMKEWTHESMVNHAASWLAARQKYEGQKYNYLACQMVLPEPHGYSFGFGGAKPDVYGFGLTTVNIECKVSRSDFLADLKKEHHHPYGHYKIYACPKNMIKPDELPEKWGLLWFTDGGAGKLVVEPIEFTDAVDVSRSVMMDIIINAYLSGDLAHSHLLRPNGASWNGKAIYLRKTKGRRVSRYDILQTLNLVNETSKEEIKRLETLLHRHGIDPHEEVRG